MFMRGGRITQGIKYLVDIFKTEHCCGRNSKQIFIAYFVKERLTFHLMRTTDFTGKPWLQAFGDTGPVIPVQYRHSYSTWVQQTSGASLAPPPVLTPPACPWLREIFILLSSQNVLMHVWNRDLLLLLWQIKLHPSGSKEDYPKGTAGF